MTLHVMYDDRLLHWRLGDDHPTNPVRAKRATELLQKRLGTAVEVHAISPHAHPGARDRLEQVHDPAYVQRTLAGRNAEWAGTRPDLGDTAALMFQGTVDATWLLRDTDASVVFAPQGAKHHAQYNYGSGFCVFADFAWAARSLADAGERVLIVDLDAHHGDGTEALTRFDKRIMSVSVHDESIFPGTGRVSLPMDQVWNYPLPAESGDWQLTQALKSVLLRADDFRPTYLLVAIGADGHETDPLSSLRYTIDGYRDAGRTLGAYAGARGLKVLLGGAGGYQPETVTPRVWAEVVEQVYLAAG